MTGTSSGRCHGPGCTQTARTEFFCSEVCVPVTVAVNGEVARDNAPSMVEAIERAAEMVGEMTSPVEEILRAYDRIEAMPPAEPIKLTRAQLDAIRVECPPPPPFPVPGAIDHLMGRRIELVDTEEESTLFTSANATSVQVASNPDPQVGWLARLFDRLFGRTT